MSCPNPAGTGSPLEMIVALAGALLLAGLLILLLARARRSRTTTAAVLVLAFCGASLAVTAGHSAHAGTACLGTDAAQADRSSDVRIFQSSELTNLAPGNAPLTITGVIINQGDLDTYVSAVTVSITAVTKASGAADGSCTENDYVLTETTMPVNQLLGPGARARFAGALIGFKNTSVNQDACKSALVSLRYVSI
jgi:hypothetical protein